MIYVIKKFMILIITLLLISMIAFFLFQIVPGDPVTARLGTNATPQRAEALREELGLNRPILLQYISWLGNFIRGDFGISYSYKMPVKDLLHGKMAVTISLAMISVFLIVISSIPMGIVTSKIKGRFTSSGFDILNQMTMAIPSFFLGIIIVLVFGLMLRWFTPGGYVSYEESMVGFIVSLIPPAIAIAIPKSAMLIKLLRNTIRNEWKEDYVRTAFSKGRSEHAVLVKHIMKNALIPVITLLGLIIADTLAGSIVVEQVFNLPGLGRLLVSSIGTRDYPVVQAIIVYIAGIVIIINFIVDLFYQWLDPRIRV